MKKYSMFGLALCLSIAATTCMAQDSGGNVGPQRVTGTQTGSAQVANPATGKKSSTQTTSQANQAPTGAPQPDATNPNRNQLSGGSKN
jgi:hypothetical protein